MRTVTFADEELSAWLNRTFVLAWYDVKAAESEFEPGIGALQPVYTEEQLAAYPEGGGGSNIRTVFCAPDGTIRHAVQGWWPAKAFREECERGLACATAKSLEASNALRSKGAAGLQLDADALAAKNPDEMKRPVRESEIARRVAALRLRATSFQAYDGAMGQVAASVLADWAEEGEGRVMK